MLKKTNILIKIAYFCIAYVIFTSNLFSDIKISAPNSFIAGDGVVFTLKISGKDVQYSDIKKIQNYKVELRSTSSQFSAINNKYQKTIEKQYRFYPLNSVQIPPIGAIVDGKQTYTKPHFVKITQATKTAKGNFVLDIKTDKSSAYVGETIKLTLVFGYKLHLPIRNVALSKINLQDVWVKPISQQKDYQKGGYGYKEVSYLLFGQKSKKVKIDPLYVAVYESDGIFGNTKKVYSNSLVLDIKATPNNTNLVGDFNIKANIDKSNVSISEPVSLKLVVNGIGNIDDLENFNLKMDDATIYENKPITKYGITNGKYGGTYTKVFSILVTKNTTIPSFSIEYFDLNTKTIKYKKSEEFKIITNNKKTTKSFLYLGANNTQAKTIEKIVYKDTSLKQKAIYFVSGFALCVLMALIYFALSKIKFSTDNNKKLIKNIKKSKNHNQLLQYIIHLSGNHKQIDKIVTNLKKDNYKQIKKDLLHHIKTTSKIYKLS